MFYRHAAFYVWNDSPTIARASTDWAEADQNVQVLRARFGQDPWGEIAANFGEFGSVNGEGYRPLSVLQNTICTYLFDSAGPGWLHLFVYGTVYGALAICLFLVSRRFGRHDATALLAVVLVLASPPLVACSWVIVAGFQALVPLLICLSLLLYWKVSEANRGRRFYLAGLCAVMLFGPWVREFMGIVAPLVGFLELRRPHRRIWMLALAAVAFGHALFPTALMKWLFFPDLPLLSVFQLGNLSNQMSGQGIRWYAAWHFLPLFPPLLLLLALGSCVLGAIVALWRRPVALERGTLWVQVVHYTIRGVLPMCWLMGTIALLRGQHMAAGLSLCLGIAVLGFQADAFLAIWFLASFVPLLRVFTEHVHFLYCLLPASIILAWSVEVLWLRVGTLNNRFAYGRFALVPMVALVVGDQLLNIYAAYRVNHATYGGMQKVASWLRHNVPKGSLVVSNVIHGVEIQWQGRGHFRNYWSVGAGTSLPDRVLEDPAKLMELWRQRGGKAIFLLDVDFDYLPGQAGYHKHKYVHRLEVPKTDIGVAYRTRARYPFIDPLRFLVPREYIPFMGAPDLVNDFYCGKSHDGRPLTYEVSAEYHVYRMTGNSLRPKPFAQLVHLVQPGFHDFNIFTDGLGYYAIPQADGALDAGRFEQGGYHPQFGELSLEDVKRRIDQQVVEGSVGPSPGKLQP
jgi:hypothetical protein